MRNLDSRVQLCDSRMYCLLIFNCLPRKSSITLGRGPPYSKVWSRWEGVQRGAIASQMLIHQNHLVSCLGKIGTPLGWHFRVGERLALVLVPSGRDVKAGNSQVLERIGIGQPGRTYMDG